MPAERIAYVHGHKRKSTVHLWPLYGQTPIASTASFGELSTLLRPLSFICCYRNYIVNPSALNFLRTNRIVLPHGKSIPVSDNRIRQLSKGTPVPAPILYARLHHGLCLIAAQGGPIYVSSTPLWQLQAMQPELVQLNRWAVGNPSAIVGIERHPKPVTIMVDGMQIKVSKRYFAALRANLNTLAAHEKDC